MSAQSNPTKTDDNHVSTVADIIQKIKSQGLFDKFRKECLADIDTKPAYRNLQQRVENYVTRFLSMQMWTPMLNKNQMRDRLRKHISQSPLLINGVARIVEQTLNPKIFSNIKPKIDEVVCDHLGIDYIQRQREMEEKRDAQRLLHSHNLPQKLMSIDPSYVPAASNSPPRSTPQLFMQPWQQFPAYYQTNQYMGFEYPQQYGVPQQFMHQWGSYQSGNPPAAPGTEETICPRPGMNDSIVPEDMDICDDLPEPPPLPPEPQPPPDDGEDPPLPPELPEEEERQNEQSNNGVHTPPLSGDLSVPLYENIVEEGQVTEEIVEMEIPCDDGNFMPEDNSVTKYHFDWTNVIDIDEVSEVGSISSIHTSDLSSFDEEVYDSNEEETTEDIKNANICKSDQDGLGDNLNYSQNDHSDTTHGSLNDEPPVQSPVVAPQYNASDSEEEETREERKIRIAREKEERFARRQQRRAEIQQKRKEFKKNIADIESTESEPKPAIINEIPQDESPKKVSPTKRRKTKAQLKEELREKKVNEKRLALRRRRTRNKRYTSDEFMSIFTDSKRPFASRSYEYEDEYNTDMVVLCEEVTETSQEEIEPSDSVSHSDAGLEEDRVDAIGDTCVKISEDIQENADNDDGNNLSRATENNDEDNADNSDVDEVYEVIDSTEVLESGSVHDNLDQYEIFHTVDEAISPQSDQAFDKNGSDRETERLVDVNLANSPKSPPPPEKMLSVTESIHSLRAGSPFSDVSDISRSVSPNEGDDRAIEHSPNLAEDALEKGKPPKHSRSRSRNGDNIGNSYKRRSSRRRQAYSSGHDEIVTDEREETYDDSISTSEKDAAQPNIYEAAEPSGEQRKLRLAQSRSLSKSRSRSRSMSRSSASKHHRHRKSRHSHRKHKKRRRPLRDEDFGLAAQQARLRDRIYSQQYTVDMKYTEPKYQELSYASPRWQKTDGHSSQSRSPSPHSRSGSPSNSSNESVLIAARRTDYHRRGMGRVNQNSDDEDDRPHSRTPEGSVHSDRRRSPDSRSLSPPLLHMASQSNDSPYLQTVSREQSEGEISDSSHQSPRRSMERDVYESMRPSSSSHRSPRSRKRRYHSPHDSPPQYRSHMRRHMSPPRRYTPSPPHTHRIPMMPPRLPPMMHLHGPPIHPPFPPMHDPHLEPPIYPLPPYDPMMRMPMPPHPLPPHPYPFGMMRGMEGPMPKRPRR